MTSEKYKPEYVYFISYFLSWRKGNIFTFTNNKKKFIRNKLKQEE